MQCFDELSEFRLLVSVTLKRIFRSYARQVANRLLATWEGTKSALYLLPRTQKFLRPHFHILEEGPG